MNGSLVLGLFALYVVGVSLFGILSGANDDLLVAVRRTWGRVRGPALFFCFQVALPLLAGIVFLSAGIVDANLSSKRPNDQHRAAALLEIDWRTIQQMRDAAEQLVEPEIYLPIPLCA